MHHATGRDIVEYVQRAAETYRDHKIGGYQNFLSTYHEPIMGAPLAVTISEDGQAAFQDHYLSANSQAWSIETLSPYGVTTLDISYLDAETRTHCKIVAAADEIIRVDVAPSVVTNSDLYVAEFTRMQKRLDEKANKEDLLNTAYYRIKFVPSLSPVL